MQTRIRSAGIWISNGQILLESLLDQELWGIPGGLVYEGESVEQACLREYYEETGLVLECDRVVLIHEHFWKDNLQTIREYGFYFVVRPAMDTAAQPVVKSLEGHMTFRWHPLSKLQNIDFVPRAIQGYLLAFPDDTVFFSTRDEEA